VIERFLENTLPSHRRREGLRLNPRLVVLLIFGSVATSVAAVPARSVPICTGVTLSASYLAVVGSDQGPGFRFELFNRTNREIKLAEPVPSSAHWYARVGERWLWRASNGSGGSLVDAGNEHGRVVVYPGALGEMKLVTLAPHQSREWSESVQENPVLAYQPGCALCSYPGEHEYRVVFAYAYLTGAGGPQGLLGCGLRSAPVPMPPKS
jgi:hypothetical protein